MECFSWSCIYYVRVGDSSFRVCCCVENLVFNFYIVFDVMAFVDCAVYLYLGSLLFFGLLGAERKVLLVLCVGFQRRWFWSSFDVFSYALGFRVLPCGWGA